MMNTALKVILLTLGAGAVALIALVLFMLVIFPSLNG